MALPVIPLPKSKVEVAPGIEVGFHSLTRKQALKVTQEFRGKADEAEIFILNCGLDVTEEEAIAWRETTDPIAVGKVVDEIIYLTGLDTRPPAKKEDEAKSPNA